MKFSLSHKTSYQYEVPVSESVGEVRLCPLSSDNQTVLSRSLDIDPNVAVGHFEDVWGNRVEFFSIPYRHSSLELTSRALVETRDQPDVGYCEEVTNAEAKQIFSSQLAQYYDFKRPSRLVPIGSVLRPLRHNFIRPQASLLESVKEINHWIYRNFEYVSGATDVETPIAETIKMRKGVCQDFAHLMLSILRTGGVPARYVSGYIEAVDPTDTEQELVGAAASHAWVEVALPGGYWWGLDPTNNQVVGQRHIKVAVGRDYDDVAPLRGTFRGPINQELEVAVSLERMGVSS